MTKGRVLVKITFLSFKTSSNMENLTNNESRSYKEGILFRALFKLGLPFIMLVVMACSEEPAAFVPRVSTIKNICHKDTGCVDPYLKMLREKFRKSCECKNPNFLALKEIADAETDIAAAYDLPDKKLTCETPPDVGMDYIFVEK